MQKWRRLMVVLSAVAFLGTVLLSSAAFAQQESKADKKASKKEKKEVQELVKLVDGVMAGKPAPTDFSVGWHNNFMKAADHKTYVPFTLSIDASKLTANPSMAMYLRAVPKTATTDTDSKKKGKNKYPFEDVHFFEAVPPASGHAFELSRAFAVPAGEYEVYIGLQQVPPKKGPKTPQLTTIVTKDITVPDYWDGQLNVSSIIVAKAIRHLQAPLSADQQADHPYAIGSAEVIPAVSHKLPKQGRLSIVFQIYNPGVDASTKKPDITVDYSFYQKTAKGEKFFNKTNPQVFNASTLPPQYNPDAGYPLPAGQTIPLATFPPGQYRLAITITDKTSGKKIEKDLLFSVVS